MRNLQDFRAQQVGAGGGANGPVRVGAVRAELRKVRQDMGPGERLSVGAENERHGCFLVHEVAAGVALHGAGGGEFDAQRERRVIHLRAIGVELVAEANGWGEDGDEGRSEPAFVPGRGLGVDDVWVGLDCGHHVQVVLGGVVVAGVPELADARLQPGQQLVHPAYVVAVRVSGDDERD